MRRFGGTAEGGGPSIRHPELVENYPTRPPGEPSITDRGIALPEDLQGASIMDPYAAVVLGERLIYLAETYLAIEERAVDKYERMLRPRPTGERPE